ncbi:hypothetical protein RB653_008790 [Dictyostelium firmibasis]|uniref:Uncharacterized protein n=1 Tax=Dictyostelium firmibasis TaxID=79012 RepID=A0AAN7YUB1_9MYCE
MQDVIRLWIPNDTDVNAPNYQIPTFENQKDLFVTMLAPSENEEEEEEEEETPDPYSQPKDAVDKKIDKLTFDWIDIMSYSHNVANDDAGRGREKSKAHIGEISLSKFICDRSPSLNYMTLRREIIPCVILRSIGEMNNNVLPIIEYEMHYCNMENVSISGGTGGKPVETLSISCKTLTIKNIQLNIATGELLCCQVCKWDTLKDSGSKTIRPTLNGTSKKSSLLDLAKKSLMVNLDSHDPSMIKLLKDLGIVSEYHMPKSDDTSEEEFYKVMTNKELSLFQLIDVPSGGITIDIIKKSISEKLNIPLESIKNLYNSTNGILVDSPKILKISNSFIVQTTDDLFVAMLAPSENDLEQPQTGNQHGFNQPKKAIDKKLKNLGIVSDCKLPKSDLKGEKDVLFKVMINKDPKLFQLIDAPSGELNVDIIKKSISEKLNIPLE